jgi:ABC-type amino acid transport substrate-binding protein
MKSIIRKISALSAAVLFSAGTAFAAKPLEGQHLKMAVSPTFPPFEFEQLDDKGNAQIVGFDIDMVNKIADDLGFTYELVHTNFKGLMGELAGARVDFVVSGMSPTEERKKTVDFSDPYYYCQTSIIQYKGTNIKHVSDLKGKKISASFGTQYCDFAEAAGAQVAAMDSSTYCMQELLAGRVDGVVQDAASASVRVKQHPELEYFVLPQDELNSVQGANVSDCFAAVFPKGSKLEPMFSEEIKKFKQDGTLKAIYEKWIGPWPYKD